MRTMEVMDTGAVPQQQQWTRLVRTGRAVLHAGGEISVTIGILFVILEAALRAFPALIPLSILTGFQEDLRQSIAGRRSVPLLSDTVLLERDDGGPPLNILKPGVEFEYGAYVANDPEARRSSKMDETGFCNTPADKYRAQHFNITTIGDSLTWCYAVLPEETWAYRLAAGKGASVYNLGVPGTGPYEYLQILKHYGLAKEPAMVIMNVFEGNDIRGAAVYAAYRAAVRESGGTDTGSAPCSLGPFCRPYRILKDGWVGRHGYAFNLVASSGRAVKNYLTDRIGAAGAGERQNARYRVAFAGEAVAFNMTNSDHDEASNARNLAAGAVRLDLFTEGLKTFMALAERHGFRPIVTYMPAAYTVYADWLTFDDPTLAPLMREYSRAQRAYFMQQSEALGYVFIDLTPDLVVAAAASIAEDRPLYFSGNTHLTAVGHAVVAAAITRSLAGMEGMPGKISR